ncbi:hypothetical protein [Aliikangiella coralliicola]|uniref:Uncharacterized protein n=1 Tax=Aliikangiella coralliicola TaxID=2592383 RepID=A0A545UEB2_9GAMM|nr:hypothetical protein [Aliikangiella coralliicola]TQV87809.1 hypothetical protein FLL46_10515 [Aliikangiella coralliicola]
MKQKLIKPENLEALPNGYGYLLIDVDVAGIAPSFSYVKVKSSKKNPRKKKKVKYSKNGTHVVTLKHSENGLYALPMPAGTYQITQINAPFFDLPYKLDTSTKNEWRFKIEAGKTNFAGHLSIKKERSTRYLDVNLINRFATEKERLENTLQQLLSLAPLAHGVGVRDDFAQALAEKESSR